MVPLIPQYFYGSNVVSPNTDTYCCCCYKVSTRCSAIAERPCCRVRYSFGQKWKTGTGRQHFTDIIGRSSTTVI